MAQPLRWNESEPPERSPITTKTKRMKTNRIALFVGLPALMAMAHAETQTKTTESDLEVAETGKKVVETSSAATNSVIGLIEDSKSFTTLRQAIHAAGIRDELDQAKAITIFAPTNEAFADLPEGALEKLLAPENKERLRTLLMHHVLDGIRLSSSFRDEGVTTRSGEKLEIDADGAEQLIEIGEADIVNTDQRRENGVVHAIDTVLIPEALDGFADLDD